MQKTGIMKERHSTLAVRLLVSFSHLSLDFKALALTSSINQIFLLYLIIIFYAYSGTCNNCDDGDDILNYLTEGNKP